MANDSGPVRNGVAPPQAAAPKHQPLELAYESLTAVSMTVGRGRAAKSVVGLASLTPQDRVVDIGCGPGTALRIAAQHCTHATGVDPSTISLRLGRWISSVRRRRNVTFAEGSAEALPLPSRSATVVRSLSAVHHWGDRVAGLAEAERVLVHGGRILLAERLTKPGTTGHAAHGLTSEEADQLARELTKAGFSQVERHERPAGHRNLVILTGTHLHGSPSLV